MSFFQPVSFFFQFQFCDYIFDSLLLRQLIQKTYLIWQFIVTCSSWKSYLLLKASHEILRVFFHQRIYVVFLNTEIFKIKNEKKNVFFGKTKVNILRKTKKTFVLESKSKSFEKKPLNQIQSVIETKVSKFWAFFQRIYCRISTAIRKKFFKLTLIIFFSKRTVIFFSGKKTSFAKKEAYL